MHINFWEEIRLRNAKVLQWTLLMFALIAAQSGVLLASTGDTITIDTIVEEQEQSASTESKTLSDSVESAESESTSSTSLESSSREFSASESSASSEAGAEVSSDSASSASSVSSEEQSSASEIIREDEHVGSAFIVNADQDRYQVGDTANISFSVMTVNGEIQCSAGIAVTVTRPDGSQEEITTAHRGIVTTGTCAEETGEDFTAFVRLPVAGTYSLRASVSIEGKSHIVIKDIVVEESAAFTIKRSGAGSMWSEQAVPMHITVLFGEDTTGMVVELLPVGADVTAIVPEGRAVLQDDGGIL